MIKIWQFFIRILNKTGILCFVNFTIPLYFNGSKVNIPIRGQIGIFNIFMDEFWISDIFSLIKHECKSCIDIGANIGQTLIKWKSIEKDIKYIGIEPNTVCCGYLEDLIFVNSYSNCTIIPAGISSSCKIDFIHFLWGEQADRSATQYPSVPENVLRSQMANFIKWDQITQFIQDDQLHLIKIDIEKAEADILHQIFESGINCIIIIEVLPLDENEEILRFERCQNAVSQAGYNIFKVRKENEKLTGLIAKISFEKQCKMSDCDYVLLKRHHIPYFKNYLLDNE